MLAVVLGVLALFAVWLRGQLLDTSSWTNTSSRLLADPKIQTAVGGLLVDELFDSVDVAGEIKSVLPSEASVLAAPAAAGLRSLATQLAPRVLATAPVQNAWRLANRTAQIQLVHVLNGGNRTLTTKNGVVKLQLHTILEDLAGQLGLKSQLASVESKIGSSNEETARNVASEKLGVNLPKTSGGIVILRSSQLRTAQNIVKAIKGLAIVLPLIALLLFVLAVYLADGWRRLALHTAGWCLVAIGLITILIRHVANGVVVGELVHAPANQPAAHRAFSIGTSLWLDLALAMVIYGLLVVIAAWIAGATRPATRVRRIVAPSLREHASYVYAGAALLLLLVVLWGPLPSTREPFAILGLAILLSLGLYVLREMTVQEFADVPLGESSHAVRTWLLARRDAARVAISSARSSPRPPAAPAPRLHPDDAPATAPIASGVQPPPAPSTSPRAAPLAELERLADLRDRGALTDQEFEREKARLLSNDS